MEFETEEQQAEAVKKWFKDYGLTIVMGLVIGLGGVYGYRYYDAEKEASFAQASVAYNEVLESLADKATFADKATKFNSEYKDTVYANLLSLQQAKLAIDSNDLASAETILAATLTDAKHQIIEHIARLRLARVLIAQEKYEQALTTIAAAKGDAYDYSYELLRGDIWLARGDELKAKQAFEKAQSIADQAPTHPDLNILLAELTAVEKPTASMSGEANE